MPTIRPLKSKSDFDAYMELCVYCFSMTREYCSYYAAFVGQYPGCALGAFDGGTMLAGMWYVPYEMNVGGADIPMGGIAAVATAPEARNLGLAKTLMTAAHRQMKAEGRSLAVLAPFKPEFYARMGYGDVFYFQNCKLRPAALKHPPSRDYRVVRVDGPREWKTFERLHRQHGQRYFGTVRRSQAYWNARYFNSLLGARFHYLVMKGKEPAGFFITHLDKPVSAYAPELSRESRLSVVQAVWTDLGAFNAFLNFIYGHRDQFNTVSWRLPADLPIRHIDEQMDIAVKPKMMLKLVDLKGAIEKRPFAADFAGDLVVRVQGEDTSPWNDGLWRIRWSGGEARATKTKSVPRAGVVKVDIQTLAVVYSGHRSASALAELGLISGPRAAIELLDRAFPRQSCYIDEWF